MRRNKHVLLAKQPHQLLNKAQHRSSVARQTLVSVLKQNPKANLLVIRSVGGIGDVLMTTPAVRTLKEEYPNCRITYATELGTSGDVYFSLLKNASFIDSIVDARYVDRSKFDSFCDISSVCIKYEHSNLPPLNRIDIFARAFGISRLRNPLPFYKVEDIERYRAHSLVDSMNSPLVFFHTASFDTKRTWQLKNQLEFLSLMNTQAPHIKVLVSDFNNLLSNKEQFENCIDISALSLRDKAAVLEAADLFVGPDSGLMHLAGALNKRGLALFGSIAPAARINHYRNIDAVVAKQKLSCQYCWYKPCSINFKCMSDITAKEVFIKVREYLNG